MPTRKRAQLERPGSEKQLPLSSPKPALRTSVTKSKPPESTAKKQPRRRPRLCKRCASSARRRNSARSFCSAFGELLKAGIFAQRIPQRIEFQIGGGNSRRHVKQMRKRGDCRIQITELCLDLGQHRFGCRLVDGIAPVILDGLLRLFESFLFFAQTGISECESRRNGIRFRRNDCSLGWFD